MKVPGLILLCLLFWAGSVLGFAVDKPNIVLIMVDDLGWSDLSCYGNPFIETPTIDGLAKQGMKFNNAYADPVCAPSRAAQHTGLYSARVKITGVPNGHRRPYGKLIPPEIYWQLKPEYTTLAEYLAPGGYVSGIFGKWHLGYDDDHQPDDQGYVKVSEKELSGDYAEKVNDWVAQNPHKGIGRQVLNSIRFMEENKDQPFFCIASFSMVHTKPQARDELVNEYKQKYVRVRTITDPAYAAMCEVVDESVGLFLEVLAALDIEEETLVIFTSDNGGVVEERRILRHGYDELVTTNWPLRGEKSMLYEGGIRVPLIVRWPGQIPAESVSDGLTHTIDFLPTLAELAGVRDYETLPTDGVSIVPELLKTGSIAPRDLFWHYPHYHHSTPASAIHSGDYKLLYFYENQDSELYDLSKDSSEQYDLVEKMPDKANELKEKLFTWLHEEVRASLPSTNPFFYPAKELVWGERMDGARVKSGYLSGERYGLEKLEQELTEK